MIELDKRILDGKKPLTAFDEELAKDFIGKECYFSDDAINFGNVVLNCQKGRLLSIGELTGLFSATKNNSYAVFNYCLPCEWVKKEEKTYRPYSLAEWIDQHEIGEVIHYRDKDYKQEFCVMYSGYIIDDGEDIQDVRTIGRIVLMFTGYFLEELFKDYEICINGEWQPFGVLGE